MFLLAAGDFDRQSIRLTGSAMEHYHWNGTRERRSIVCTHVHPAVIVRVCVRVRVTSWA